MEPSDLPDTVQHLLSEVARSYADHPEVRAVALGGPRVSKFTEADSDLDLYVYLERPRPIEARRRIATRSARRSEVGNQFWESGDEWIDDASGLQLDVMFRDTGWIEEELNRNLVHHQAAVGYSTCFWDNVRASIVLHDPSGWFAGLRSRANQPYPDELRQAIIDKNHPILRSTISSYRTQIARALDRGDIVSVNHRVAALLASYFDILFALNRRTHPGEKRLLAHARANCSQLPENFESQISQLVKSTRSAAGAAVTLTAIDALVDDLDTLLRLERLTPSTATIG
jgi:hypothetical protein